MLVQMIALNFQSTKIVKNMLTTITNITLLITLGFAGFFMFKKIRGHQKPKHTPPVDPVSQKLYEEAHLSPKEEDLKLTLQERIDLSWQFLTKITEQIMNHFSTKDQKIIQKAGNQLIQNGANYQHNVNQELQVAQKVTKTRAIQQTKEKGVEHSR